MPAGSASPVLDQVMVPLPPDWVKAWSKTTPAVPEVTPGGVTVMTLQPMTSVYVAPVPAQPLESVTVTTIGNVPDWVGVPSRTPVAECRVRPVGSVLAVVYDAVPRMPDEVKVWLKAEATVPVVVAGFVTV